MDFQAIIITFITQLSFPAAFALAGMGLGLTIYAVTRNTNRASVRQAEIDLESKRTIALPKPKTIDYE